MALALAALVLLALLSLWYFATVQTQSAQRALAQQQLSIKSSEFRAVLEREMNATLHLTTALISYIDANNGEIDQRELAPWINGLLQSSHLVRNIGLAPDLRLQFIFPLQGNEKALGLYYPDLTEQWPEVQRLINERSAVLAGPVNLVQGGRALIYRAPVYLSDGRFWGLLSTVLNLSPLESRLQHTAAELGIDAYVDRQVGAERQVVLGKTFVEDEFSIFQDIEIPGANWRLHARFGQNYSASVFAGSWLAYAWVLPVLLSAITYFGIQNVLSRMSLRQALSRSEQHFRQVFHGAPQGMALLDQHAKFLDLNKQLAELLGKSREQLLGTSLLALIRDSEREAMQQRLLELQQPDPVPVQIELKLNTSTQTPIVVALSLAMLSKDDKSPIIVGQFHDLSERLRLDRIKDEFIATVSHELRTPITSINGVVSLLHHGVFENDAEEAKRMIAIAHENGQRLHRLVNDLLEVEKLDAGKLMLQVSLQSVVELVQASLRDCEPYAQTFGIHLRAKFDQDRAIHVDPVRLQQVLANLLSNAIKFSPRDSDVLVTTQNVGNRVAIAVVDQGAGIPRAFQHKLFHRFARADDSNTRLAGGTGLGLAISKDLVEQMQGQIEVESKEGQGSVFRIWFHTA